MYKLRYPLLFLFVFGISVTSCNKEPNVLDTDVTIIRTYKISQKAFVKYTVKNIGENDIRGWNIYFRVSMVSSKQVKAYQGLTYGLKPGETSEILIARGDIPDHFDDVDKPSLAALQLIEVY